MQIKNRWKALAILGLALSCGGALAQSENPGILGSWDLTVGSGEAAHPAWLRIERSGFRTLVGAFVGRFGSVRPISEITYNEGRIQFSIPVQWEGRKTPVAFEGKLSGDTLSGWTTDDEGKQVAWTAKRAPDLKRAQKPEWDKPIELFNGRDLDGWKPRDANRANSWSVQNGVLVGKGGGTDLMTTQKFTDFKLRIEFRYPKGSNSGIYLRGRYEVQIQDDFGKDPESHGIGGVYGFLTPSVNAAKRPGEWQTFDITLVGRTLTLIHNGERVIDRQTIPGITGGALDSDEGAPGPLFIQGDHGAVEIRKITLTPIKNG